MESPLIPSTSSRELGIVYCQSCGNRMVGTWNTQSGSDKRVSWYICGTYNRTGQCNRNGVQAEELEAQVVQRIEALLDQEAFNREVSKSQAASQNDLEPMIKRVKKDISAVSKMLDHTFDLLLRETINDEEFKQQRERLNKQKDQLNAQLQDLEAKQADSTARQRAAVEVWSVLEHFRRVWSETTIDEKKVVIRSIVKAIQWNAKEKTATIEYQF